MSAGAVDRMGVINAHRIIWYQTRAAALAGERGFYPVEFIPGEFLVLREVSATDLTVLAKDGGNLPSFGKGDS